MSDSACSPEAWGIVQPITGNMTYHTLAKIISGACAILVVLLCVGLAASHLFKFRCAPEQRQIVRIVATPAVFAVFTVLSVCFYGSAGYLKPIGEYYESISMVALFYLFISHATPNDARREHPFENLEVLAAIHPDAGLSSYYKNWIMVHQILAVRMVTLIATLAISGSECKLLGSKSKAQTIISVIQTLSTIMCLLSILRVYKTIKPSLVNFGPLAKLFSLKLIVALDVLQSLVFSILSNHGVIKPTTYLNRPDLLIGTPGLMLCAECFIFAVIFLWSFNSRPYSANKNQQAQPRIGAFAALLKALNISDIIYGLVYCITASSGGRSDEGGNYNGYQYNPAVGK